MTEILFYHLERSTLEKALPGLLVRSLDRGWRVVVQLGSEERLDALNAHLWTYEDGSFLPHGSAKDGNASGQPVFLTVADDNPNRANVRFLVDNATTRDFGGYDRIVFMFDAADSDALASARETWTAARQGDAKVTYWRQDENGRWRESGGA